VAWTQVFLRRTEVADPRTIAIARAFDAGRMGSSYAAAGQYLEDRLEGRHSSGESQRR